MKRPRLSFLVVLAWSLSACSSKKPPESGELVITPASASPSLPAAAVEPLEIGGQPKPLADIVAGKVAIIDLWATWCTACRDVSKNVELMAEAHREKAFIAVGLDVGEERDVVSAFFGGTPPKIPIYLDTQFRVADALGARELPTILVVDRDGKIRMVKKKVDSDVLRLVDKLLADEKPAPSASATP
jgi:thiol-disulfide isomerase/thioredoxin